MDWEDAVDVAIDWFIEADRRVARYSREEHIDIPEGIDEELPF